MGEAISNLVIVKGNKDDVAKFKDDAYLNQSRAFCFEQLLPIPDNLTNEDEIEWREQNYGNKWGAGFAVIFKEQTYEIKYTDEKENIFTDIETEIHYFFNSKNKNARIDEIINQYPNLKFIHFYYDQYSEYMGPFWGCREYLYGKKQENELLSHSYIDGIYDAVLNLNSELLMRTPAHIEELYLKYTLLKEKYYYDLNVAYDHNYYYESNPEDANKQFEKAKEFYNFFDRKTFLRKYKNFYDELFRLEQELCKKDLEFAKKKIYYSLKVNTVCYLSKYKFDIADSISQQKLVISDFFLQIEQNNCKGDSSIGIFCNYIYKNGFEQEVKDFSTKYIKTTIKKIDNFFFNIDKYNKTLADYYSVIPTLFVSEDIFIQYYILKSNWMPEDLKKTYIEKVRELIPFYDICLDEGNQFEAIFMPAYKEYKNTKNTINLEGVIKQRWAKEQKAKMALHKAEQDFKNADFDVITSIDIDMLYKLLDDIGIILNKNGAIAINNEIETVKDDELVNAIKECKDEYVSQDEIFKKLKKK